MEGAMEMTDKQFNKIIKMVRMIIDKCDDLEEAKRRLAELDDDSEPEIKNPKEEKTA